MYTVIPLLFIKKKLNFDMAAKVISILVTLQSNNFISTDLRGLKKTSLSYSNILRIATAEQFLKYPRENFLQFTCCASVKTSDCFNLMFDHIW